MLCPDLTIAQPTIEQAVQRWKDANSYSNPGERPSGVNDQARMRMDACRDHCIYLLNSDRAIDDKSLYVRSAPITRWLSGLLIAINTSAFRSTVGYFSDPRQGRPSVPGNPALPASIVANGGEDLADLMPIRDFLIDIMGNGTSIITDARWEKR